MATDAKRKANAAYQKRQDNLTIRPNKAEGARIRQAAADRGLSVQAYILDVLRHDAAYIAAQPAQTMEENEEKGL